MDLDQPLQLDRIGKAETGEAIARPDLLDRELFAVGQFQREGFVRRNIVVKPQLDALGRNVADDAEIVALAVDQLGRADQDGKARSAAPVIPRTDRIDGLRPLRSPHLRRHDAPMPCPARRNGEQIAVLQAKVFRNCNESLGVIPMP